MIKKNTTELGVYSIFEINFKINCEITQVVVTLDINRLSKMIDLDNRNYITQVKCISSTLEIISLILLISDVNILHKWCIHN